MRYSKCLGGCLLFLMLGFTSVSQAGSINLNDFFGDPTVTVAADGSSADFAEDPPFPSVILSNDPSFGDPNIIVPGANVSVEFMFTFVEALGNSDEFGAFVIDSATGLSAGPAYEFFSDTTGSGSVQIDISELTGQTLGFQFQLTSLLGDTGADSTLNISNVRLLDTAQADEPATLVLTFVGVVALLGVSRRRSLLTRSQGCAK
jgi:hypothetical protein